MFASVFKTALLTTFLTMTAGAAEATVIDFSGLTTANGYIGLGATTSIADGFTMASTGAAAVFGGNIYSLYGDYASNGTNIMRLTTNGTAVIKSASGALFTVNSIDLANFYFLPTTTAYTTTATLTGTYANGTTIVSTYILNNNNIVSANDFTTEALLNFTNLQSFTIKTTGYYLDVDNIVINQATNVPEPASLAILGLGLVGMGAVRRRKSAI